MLKCLVLIIVIFVSGLFAQVQDSTLHIIPSSYSSSMKNPRLIRIGQLVKFEADSIYLVNKARFHFYEELRNTLMTLDFDCEPTIELYKNSLSQNTLLAQQLLNNSAITNRLNTELINSSQLLLSKQTLAVNISLDNLNSAKENLGLAKSELSKMGANNFWENILYSLAGIGIGVIVGVSIN